MSEIASILDKLRVGLLDVAWYGVPKENMPVAGMDGGTRFPGESDRSRLRSPTRMAGPSTEMPLWSSPSVSGRRRPALRERARLARSRRLLSERDRLCRSLPAEVLRVRGGWSVATCRTTASWLSPMRRLRERPRSLLAVAGFVDGNVGCEAFAAASLSLWPLLVLAAAAAGGGMFSPSRRTGPPAVCGLAFCPASAFEFAGALRAAIRSAMSVRPIS